MSNFFQNPFGAFFSKKMLGIDVGTSSIKVVEVASVGAGKTLENYGQIQSASIYKDSVLAVEKGSTSLSSDFVAKAIKGILSEARIKTKSAIFSIPDFSTFCTSFDMPPMTDEEIPNAIRYNASQYITLPISEVTLDWKIAKRSAADKNAPVKVFLVAVPNQVIQEYKSIANMAGLQLVALEAEALGVARSLVRNNKKIVCVMDIGMQSSTINVIDGDFLKKSYSFNFNGGQLTRVVSSSLGVSYQEAEKIKNEEGLLHPKEDLVKTLYLLLDPLLFQMRTICAEFLQSERQAVEEIYLTGGTANLPGLKEYVFESLKKPVVVPNCFSGFLYPPILEETLKEMAPSFSAAVGSALGGFET